jgi:NADH-quinone oxidoreductase subunit L
MSLSFFSYTTLFAPLAGCVVIALLGMRLPAKAAGWLGTSAMAVSFLSALGALSQWNEAHGVLLTPYTWLTAGKFQVGFDLFIDSLSMVEMLVVSGVGMLIVLYSIGYMHGDTQVRRFFAYMNLFAFAMLVLVMAGNFVFVLIGWGLVGLASYLLIGFWHDRPTAVAAAKKAFIINAIGDVSMMLGLFLVFVKTGVVDYPAAFILLPSHVDNGSGTALAICLLLLGGAAAKSAQLPLHTWLPDAMEGPTPVSALIHAATMVTAGVYLIARMWPVFDLSIPAQHTVALMGAITLVVAGLIALVQTDIKRAIAYSTISQIGYMFTAVGVGAYGAAMFHLMTHAFFKALLFLAAGVIIHALDEEQDMREMGGLRKLLPHTYRLFVIASFALAGIVPLSGFFSKDEILAGLFASGQHDAVSYVVWGLALAGVVVTGLYSMRTLLMTFHGEQGAASKAYAEHPHEHEGPKTMMVPITILGVLSAVAGFIAIPGVWDALGDFLERDEAAPARERVHEYLSSHVGVIWALDLAVSLPLALLGVAVAWMIWGSGTWRFIPNLLRPAEPALQAALYFDWIQHHAIYRPTAWLARMFRGAIERILIAGSVDRVSDGARRGASLVSAMQDGLLRVYALGTAVGLAALGTWLAVRG